MAGAELVTTQGREAEQRLPIGLLVSTGSPKPARGPGRPIDHFRFKAGADDQYADAADRARAEYGDEPKTLDEVVLLSNVVSDVLDIRVKAWSQSGLRIFGRTNLAALPRDEFLERWDAWTDDILYFPREPKDVPARLRDSWRGEPIEGKLDGPGDPRIGKYEMHVEATLRFSLPRALGLGTVCLYSTKSRRIGRSLYESVWFAHRAFEGRLIGIPFRLSVRPRRTERFDEEKRKKVATSVYEVVFDTPFTYQEAIDVVAAQREALAAAPERPALEAAPAEFFRDDDRDSREANDPAFIPVESFDPELRDVEDGEFTPTGEATDWEALIPESVQAELREEKP